VEKYGIARQATNDNIIQGMCFACWIAKATDTQSEYVLSAFPWQQWFHEPASMLHLLIHRMSCLVIISFTFTWVVASIKSFLIYWFFVVYSGSDV
jgi:hypothetical protein